MNINDQLQAIIKELRAADITTARLDAFVLLEDELGKDRAWILAHLDDLIPKMSKKFIRNVKRRLQHEPLAYIRGRSEFFGRTFIVNNHTLVPRPESETMIELAVKHAPLPAHIIDVGCGSGALGITLALELPESNLTLIDIDEQCLTVTKQNVATHKVSADIIQSNLLEPVNDASDEFIVLANLPYVPDSHTINKAAMLEPSHAIFGGPDGLDLYREMFQQISIMRAKPKLIFTEALPPSHKELVHIAKAAGYNQLAEQDFIQVFAK